MNIVIPFLFVLYVLHATVNGSVAWQQLLPSIAVSPTMMMVSDGKGTLIMLQVYEKREIASKGRRSAKEEKQRELISIHHYPSHNIFTRVTCIYTTQQQVVMLGIGQTTTTLL